jgi:ubiquinone/menaquinone biosynthesis C-methylase UbiE
VHVTEKLDTAHETWDKNWTSDRERSKWLEPDAHVCALVPSLSQRGFSRVLDVGCGIGRHAHYLASEGLSCVGTDASQSGLTFARERAAAAGLAVEYRAAPFYELPFEDGSFEAVIAWNVIYHGDGEIAQRAIDEFARVLVPGGLYVGTLLSKRNSGYGRGHEVRPDTFVVVDATDDKVHPHFYCDALMLLKLHHAFDVLSLQDQAQSPGANHWQYTFERANVASVKRIFS